MKSNVKDPIAIAIKGVARSWDVARWALIVCIVLPLGGCGILQRVYDYKAPTSFNGHRWGETIQEFGALEFLSACQLEYTSCTQPLPLEISAYIQRPQTFEYPGVKLSSVVYIFCYSGTVARFCGSMVGFESEEFELADHHETTDGLTNFERLRAVLAAQLGLPHRGELPRKTIKVFDSNGNFIVTDSSTQLRYSWCGLNDPHAPRECPVTVVLDFSPLMGHGDVVYATPELTSAIRQWQQVDAYPNSLYEVLFAFAKPYNFPVPVGCSTRAAARLRTPFEGMKPGQRSQMFSEMWLDALAYREDRSPEDPARALSPQEMFDQEQRVRRELTRNRKNGALLAYWLGYSMGLGHTYYGGHEGTEEAHMKWLRANGATEKFLQVVASGYSDGLRMVPRFP